MATSIYIAGASAELERCEAFRDACVAMGYALTFDWMANVREHGQANGNIGTSARRHAKNEAYYGATRCDAFVLLLTRRVGWTTTSTIGAWVELGASVMDHNYRRAVRTGWERDFLIVGELPERTIFTVDLTHVATDAEALERLRGMVTR